MDATVSLADRRDIRASKPAIIADEAQTLTLS